MFRKELPQRETDWVFSSTGSLRTAWRGKSGGAQYVSLWVSVGPFHHGVPQGSVPPEREVNVVPLQPVQLPEVFTGQGGFLWSCPRKPRECH